MGRHRSSLRQVPWQSWEHWNWVATELFADSPERVSGALDRIAAWRSRGKVPIAVETSAAIIGIHQKDPQINHGIPKEAALPEEMLRMVYAMAIQRLVNGVVDQSQKRNTTSVADRAEFAKLPRLLVDIRHEAAHTELPELALLQVASKQALAWLKLQYWDQQKETIVNVRLKLKLKLVEHCLLVVDILNPTAASTYLQQSEEKKSEDPNSLVDEESLEVKKQQRKGLFDELLDLSLSSMSNLISSLVHDGLLEQGTLSIEKGSYEQRDITIGSTEGADLTSATDSALKFTLRELSSHLPRLPEMLLVAILKYIKKSYPRGSTSSWSEEAGPTRSHASDPNSDEVTDPSLAFLLKSRLISWCVWLLGKRSVQASEESAGKEPPKTELLRVSNSFFVRPNLSKEILADLLKLCLSMSNGQDPLVDLLSLIAVRLGNEKFLQRVSALAQLGTSMQRLHRNDMGTSENQEKNATFVGEESRQEGVLKKVTASSPGVGDDSSFGSEPTMELALEKARTQQRAFLAGFSPRRKGVQSSTERLYRKEETADSLIRLHQGTPSPLIGSSLKDHNSTFLPSNGLSEERSELQSWTVVENWRPCAIGLIPSPCQSLGVLPSLDFCRQAYGSEGAAIVTRKDVSSEGTSAATNTEAKIFEKNHSAATYMVEPLVGKRTSDEQLDVSRGKKAQKVGRLVHFEGESPTDVEGRQAKDAFEFSLTGPSIPNRGVGHEPEQINTGSLLQGCLLQQGMFMPVTLQQFEALKAAVHVL